ncbi:MAG: DMT family transporter [Rhodospirillaceae bacterium]|jgi:drug/metabolite transporter (DMT)-like permease
MPNKQSDSSQIVRLGDNIQGVLWMFIAMFLLTGMFAIAKHLTETLPIMEVASFRFSMSLLFYLPWLFKSGLGALKTERHFAHFWRSFFGCTSLACGVYAVHHLLLADAQVLTFTIPLWSILLAAFVLRERIRAGRTIATIIGFIGVIIVVQPQGGIEIASAVALLAAILASFAITTMKHLTRTEPSNRIVFYFLLWGTVIIGFPAAFNWIWPNWDEWLWLLGLGFVGSTGQYCLTRAYAAGDMTLIAPLDFIRIIIAGLYGYLLFSEIPGPSSFIGAAVIMLACGYIVRQEAILRQNKG